MAYARQLGQHRGRRLRHRGRRGPTRRRRWGTQQLGSRSPQPAAAALGSSAAEIAAPGGDTPQAAPGDPQATGHATAAAPPGGALPRDAAGMSGSALSHGRGGGSVLCKFATASPTAADCDATGPEEATHEEGAGLAFQEVAQVGKASSPFGQDPAATGATRTDRSAEPAAPSHFDGAVQAVQSQKQFTGLADGPARTGPPRVQGTTGRGQSSTQLAGSTHRSTCPCLVTTGSPLTRREATELGDAKADLNAIFIAALDRDGVLDAPVHRVQGVDSAPFWCGLGVPKWFQEYVFDLIASRAIKLCKQLPRPETALRASCWRHFEPGLKPTAKRQNISEAAEDQYNPKVMHDGLWQPRRRCVTQGMTAR